MTFTDWLMIGVGLGGLSFIVRGIMYAIEDRRHR